MYGVPKLSQASGWASDLRGLTRQQDIVPQVRCVQWATSLRDDAQFENR